jgi:hypothetical protein
VSDEAVFNIWFLLDYQHKSGNDIAVSSDSNAKHKVSTYSWFTLRESDYT